MAQKTLINDMTEGKIGANLLRFSFPLMLTNLLQTLYNMVDMIVIGRFSGSVGLSAVSIGGEVLMMLTFMSMGLCGAGQIIIAQYVGAKDKENVSRSVGTMFTVVLCSAAAVSLLFLFITKPLLTVMNTPEEAFHFTFQYVITCVIGLVFIYGYNIVCAIMRGMGNSRQPLIFVAIAAVTNLILDLLFVAVFKMEVFGTALATVIGQAVAFICSLIYLYAHKEAFNFDFRPSSFKPDKNITSILIKLGIPMCLQSGAICASMLFVGAFINKYGVVRVAITGVGNRLGSVASVVCMAISTSCGSVIGQCVGARKYERVPRTIGVALMINCAFTILLSAIMIITPRGVFGLFDQDPEVLDLAVIYVPVAVINFMGFAFRSPFFGLVNGVGNPTLNLMVGLFDGVICRIGLTYLLGVIMGFGIQGFWYGTALAGYAPFVIGFIYYLSGKWRGKSLIAGRK